MRCLSTSERAEQWWLFPHRAGVLCSPNRIPGAHQAGSRWIIPEAAEKPADARIKSGKFIRAKNKEWYIPSRECILPGTVIQRLAVLMKCHKVSQTDLALKIGYGDSLLSRFLTGKTGTIGDENIILIARVFNVSTDFLSGMTNVPDRNNYEIDEPGLSPQAARNHYTGKVIHKWSIGSWKVPALLN